MVVVLRSFIILNPQFDRKGVKVGKEVQGEGGGGGRMDAGGSFEKRSIGIFGGFSLIVIAQKNYIHHVHKYKYRKCINVTKKRCKYLSVRIFDGYKIFQKNKTGLSISTFQEKLNCISLYFYICNNNNNSIE